MKKFVIIIMAAMFSATTISASTSARLSNRTTNKESNGTQTAVKKQPVEVIYFHGKQRCMTCMAIEKETKALVEGELAQQVKAGKVKLRIVDFTTAEGKKLADKYRVTFSSLFIVTQKGTEDLTRFAFANARSNAEKFRKDLKNEITKAIK